MRVVRHRRKKHKGEEKNVIIAYLLMFFLGFFGLHKFYLGKVSHGVAYLVLSLSGFGGVLVFFGLVYDFFTLPHQVFLANQQLGYNPASVHEASEILDSVFHSFSHKTDDDGIIEAETYEVYEEDVDNSSPKNRQSEPKKTLEQQFIELAEQAEMSQLTLKDCLKAGYSLEDAKSTLERLATEGVCEEVMMDGVRVYVF